MLASVRIKNFTKNEEGLRLEVYNDGFGNLTVGYGHKLPKGSPVREYTLVEVEALLEQDVLIAEQAINNHVKVPLLQREFDSLVDFVFNLGGVAFAQSTILMYLNEGRKLEACSWMPRYSHVGTKIVVDLLLRRLKAASIFMGLPVATY